MNTRRNERRRLAALLEKANRKPPEFWRILRTVRNAGAAILAIVICAAIIWYLVAHRKSYVTLKNYDVDPKDIIDLGNTLINSVNPALPENAYMPAYMREKLNWIFTEAGQYRLATTITVSPMSLPDGTMASYAWAERSERTHDMPTIFVNGTIMWYFIRIQDGQKEGYSQKNKNDFALYMTHEAAHLERNLKEGAPRDSIIAEETRVYFKVDLEAVRPLREMGQPIDSVAFLALDDILKRCGDKIDCNAFKKAVIAMNPPRQER